MKKKTKDKEYKKTNYGKHNPTVAPGMSDFIEKSATEKDIENGD